tara:strand:+ start:1275 stop:1733 length:459 start_codon:yes stop_codon:yes gene_type:complete
MTEIINSTTRKLNMKNLLIIAFSSLLMFSPLSITSAHQHSDKSHMPMNMMDDASMEKMNQHITKMNSVLEKIKQENDPAKREQMLNEHAKSMQDMMGMMHHSKGDSSMMHGKEMSAEMKISMMEKRLQMMEKMMEQMMGHTVENSKKVHEHK